MAKAKAKDGAEGSAGGHPRTKREAVKMGLMELGLEAKPPALHDHILKTWGMDISNNHISSYKSGLKQELGGGKHHGRRPGRPPAPRDAALQVKDIQTIKELVNRLGADRVRELIGVFHQ